MNGGEPWGIQEDSGCPGSICAMVIPKSGSVNAEEIQKRRVMSRSSGFSSSAPGIVRGLSAPSRRWGTCPTLRERSPVHGACPFGPAGTELWGSRAIPHSGQLPGADSRPSAPPVSRGRSGSRGITATTLPGTGVQGMAVTCGEPGEGLDGWPDGGRRHILQAQIEGAMSRRGLPQGAWAAALVPLLLLWNVLCFCPPMSAAAGAPAPEHSHCAPSAQDEGSPGAPSAPEGTGCPHCDGAQTLGVTEAAPTLHWLAAAPWSVRAVPRLQPGRVPAARVFPYGNLVSLLRANRSVLLQSSILRI
jgi:hypothetical protein